MDGRVRIAIVEDNDLWRRAIEDALALDGRFTLIGSAADGEAGLELILGSRADVALLDVALPKKDGLYILEELGKLPPEEKPAVCVMITGISQEHVTRKALEAGADYYMVKPIDVDLLIRRALEIYESKKGAAPPAALAPAASAAPPVKNSRRREIEAFVTDLLHKMQISTSLKGYGYLKYAVVMGIEDPAALGGITKTLYPAIAREFKTTPTRAERAIRHAIDSTWAKGYGKNYRELLGYGDAGEPKPTNSVLISSLAELYEMRR